MNDLDDFKQFMKTREAASQAFVNGDAAPLDRVSTHHSPASIFGPMGNCVQGASHVNAANAGGAKMFRPGGESSFEIQQIAVDGGLAFLAGIQRSKVVMQGKDKAIAKDLRVTEIFRREDDEWKLVHRHADALKPETAVKACCTGDHYATDRTLPLQTQCLRDHWRITGKTNALYVLVLLEARALICVL